MEKNPYLILEVPRLATRKEISEAYRRLARQFHPDVNKSPAAAIRMREINWAYEVLNDPVKRALINRKHKAYREKWESRYWQSSQASTKPRAYPRAKRKSAKSNEKTWSFARQEPSLDFIRILRNDPGFGLPIMGGFIAFITISLLTNNPFAGLALSSLLGFLLYTSRDLGQKIQSLTLVGFLAPFLYFGYLSLPRGVVEETIVWLCVGTFWIVPVGITAIFILKFIGKVLIALGITDVDT